MLEIKFLYPQGYDSKTKKTFWEFYTHRARVSYENIWEQLEGLIDQGAKEIRIYPFPFEGPTDTQPESKTHQCQVCGEDIGTDEGVCDKCIPLVEEAQKKLDAVKLD